MPIRLKQTKSSRLITDGAELRRWVVAAQRADKTVGFVPTMGALHDGHLSLVDRAASECELSVVSIFVNPTQFGPSEDLQQYPSDLPSDLKLLATRQCDVVFVPTVDEMYPPGYETYVDVGSLATTLEGEWRPTHFRGVATVVLKLMQMVPADSAYFGQKDYQQILVIKRMVTDLNVAMEIRICPTVREPDGLAMSSRNAYLSDDQRRQATVLYRSLQLAQQLVRDGCRSCNSLRQEMIQKIAEVGGVELQYIAFVAEGTVAPVEEISAPTVVLLAGKVGKTRLIDNCIIR